MDSLQVRIEALPRELKHQPNLQTLLEKAVEVTSSLEKEVSQAEGIVSVWPEMSNRYNSILDQYFQIPFNLPGAKRILKGTSRFPNSLVPDEINHELDSLQNLVSKFEHKAKKQRRK